MYKASMFNYLSKDGILFNSGTGKVVELVNPLLAKEILKNPERYTEDDLYKNLVVDGFLVPLGTNEHELVRLQELEKVFSSRLGLIIYPTMDCNFRCSYCYQEHDKKYMSKTCQNAIINHLRKNISKYTAVDIGWFGGEPLLAFDIIEFLSKKFIEICRQAKTQYSATISTNGYGLDLETFRKLLELKVINYQITLDGDREHHDKVRRSLEADSSYDKIINNLLEIKNKISSSSFTFSIRTNITQDMLDTFPEHLEKLWELFGDDRRFSFLFRPVGDWGGTRAKKMSSSFVSDMNEIYRMVLDSKYALNYSEYYFRLLDGMCEARKRNSFALCVDGQIRKCTLAFNRDINKLGYIDDNGDFIIDKNKLYHWTMGAADSKDECSDCFYLAQCYGSTCPLKRQTGMNSQSVCGYEVENIDEVLRMIVNSKEYIKGISRY